MLEYDHKIFFMEVDLLEDDEILVESEVRGLIKSGTTKVTNTLRRLLAESIDFDPEPLSSKYQHEAAKKYPAQEAATVQVKLQEVKRFLLLNIQAGRTVEDMLPLACTKLKHIDGRMSRSVTCDIFSEKFDEMFEARSELFRVVGWIDAGWLTPRQAVEKLSRVRIKVYEPVVHAEIVEIEFEEEVVEEIAVREERPEVTAQGSVQNTSPLQNFKNSVTLVDHLVSEPLICTCSYAEEGNDVVYRLPTKIRGKTRHKFRKVFGRRKRRPRLRRKAGARFRLKGRHGASCISAQFRREVAMCVDLGRAPVDHLRGVLDLRLEDEVLARSNRRLVAAKI